MSFEGYLQKIDTTLNKRTKKEIYMIYIMIIALIFTFSYLLFWESSQNELIQKLNEVKALNSQINSNKTYLHNNSDSNIIKLDFIIEKLQKELITYKDNNAYIKEKLKTVSLYKYDENSWGEYLDSISKSAQNYEVKLLNFSNNYVLSKQSFGHILDVSLQCKGEYQNILKFINSLEQSELVVDVHSLNMKAKENLYTDLNLSVWGIQY